MLDVIVYSMLVVKELDNFPESEHRKREWFKINDAAKQVSNEVIGKLILSLTKVLKQ